MDIEKCRNILNYDIINNIKHLKYNSPDEIIDTQLLGINNSNKQILLTQYL